jgi:hypothetical protein
VSVSDYRKARIAAGDRERPTRALITYIHVPAHRAEDMRIELQRWTASAEDHGPNLGDFRLGNPLPLEWVEHSMHELGLLCVAERDVATGKEPG